MVGMDRVRDIDKVLELRQNQALKSIRAFRGKPHGTKTDFGLITKISSVGFSC